MVEVIKEITVDTLQKNRFLAVVAKQHDARSRFLRVEICREGKRIALPGELLALLTARRADGESKAFPGRVEEDGRVLLPLPAWLMEIPGRVECAVSLIGEAGEDGGDPSMGRLTSTGFEIEVERAAYDGDDVAEDENYDILVRLLSECAEANTAANQALEQATEASAKATAAAASANTASSAANQAKKDADAATAGANAAAKAANDAAAAANTAKSNAEKAAGSANTAAGAANTAAESAIAAAEAANTAKTGADTAAERANTAAASVNTAAERAEAAAKAADTAAAGANAAAAGAEKVDLSAVQTATGADITVTDRRGAQTTVHIDTLLAIDSWEDVRNAIRLGLGEKLFPVGYEFTTADSTFGTTLIWAVRGHNCHKAANGRLTNTMTLETKYVYGDERGLGYIVAYDAPEALYYAEGGLPAGTYHFTVVNSTYSADEGKDFQFTLTKALPAGGQIFLAAAYDQTVAGKTATTHASVGAAAAMESVTLTAGSGGTSLGRTDGTGGLNFYNRIPFGSNNYAQSAIRQWINSGGAAGTWWKGTTRFDRPPVFASRIPGFLYGLPADFLAVVQPAALPCCTNTVFETASLDGAAFPTGQGYTLNDKFFLLSRPEISGVYDNPSCKDGNVLPYYSGLSPAERIKYDPMGNARSVWLRTPMWNGAVRVRFADKDGTADSANAYKDIGAAPACIIA